MKICLEYKLSRLKYLYTGRLRGGRAYAAGAPGGGPLLRRDYVIDIDIICNDLSWWRAAPSERL